MSEKLQSPQRFIAITIFSLVFLTTILSYISIFLPYYVTGEKFDTCIAKPNEQGNICFYGEVFHIIELFLLTLVSSFIISYLIMRFNNGAPKMYATPTKINDVFSSLSVPIIVLMFIAMACSVVSLGTIVKTDETVDKILNNFQEETGVSLNVNTNVDSGLYLRAISVGLNIIVVILCIVMMFLKRKK